MNAKDEIVVAVIVFSDYDQRICIVIDDNVSKSNHLLDWTLCQTDWPKTKLNWVLAHSRLLGTKLKYTFINLNDKVMKMDGKAYIN